MALTTLPTLRTNLLAALNNAAAANSLSPDALRAFFEACVDSCGTVGGGILSHRAVGGADPATQNFSTSPAHINVGWTANMESRGLTPDFANARLTIGADAGGSYKVDWSISFKGATAGRRYVIGVNVNRGGNATFENDGRAEVSIDTAGMTTVVGASGYIVNLSPNDTVELWCQASAASSPFVLRQAQLQLLRVA